jgi:copper resistance protein D
VFLATDALVLVLRALTFVALFEAVGLAIFLSLNEPATLGDSADRLRNVARVAALVALSAAVAHYLLTPARMAGNFAGTFDPALDSLLLRSNSGSAHIVRVVALSVLFLSLDRTTLLNTRVATGAAVLALVSFVVMGHTAIHPWRWLLGPLLLVHLATAAYWFGALWAFHDLIPRESAAVTGALLARFSERAVRWVPAIFVCGVLMGVVLIGSPAGVATGYGAFVVGKAGAFAVLMGLAAKNRWRFVPALAAGDAGAGVSLRRTVLVEWLIIVGVLIGTAVMTSLFSPEHLEGVFSQGHEH